MRKKRSIVFCVLISVDPWRTQCSEKHLMGPLSVVKEKTLSMFSEKFPCLV